MSNPARAAARAMQRQYMDELKRRQAEARRAVQFMMAAPFRVRLNCALSMLTRNTLGRRAAVVAVVAAVALLAGLGLNRIGGMLW